MSLFLRLWRKITNPTGLVGRDLEGNKYYEYANAVSSRPKRVVKYRRGYDMWTYVAGGKKLPVQWSAWLTHTRLNPPTLQELHADLQRQQRVVLGAAMIEARERDAMLAARLAEPSHVSSLPPSNPQSSRVSDSSGQTSQTERVSEAGGTWHGKPNPFVQLPQDTDATLAWTPRAIRRG